MTRRSSVALIAFLVVTVLLLVPLPHVWSLRWRAALLDLGHVPLFAAFVVALRFGTRLSLVACVSIAVAVAGLGEVLQDFTGRTASWSDWLNGSLGALAAMAVLLAGSQRRISSRRAIGLLLLAVALVTWPVVQVAPTLYDAVEGYREMPTLAGFQTEREMRRWETNQAEIRRELDPEGHWSATLTFQPGPADYPGATLAPVVSDLIQYHKLFVSFTLEGEPLELVLSIRGGPVEGEHTNHFQVAQKFPPGFHTIWLSLDSAYKFAKPHGLDLSEVASVQLFVVRPALPRTIHVRRVWVER